MTLAEWQSADPERRVTKPEYQASRAQYLVTAADPNGLPKRYVAFGDNEHEALENLAGQIGLANVTIEGQIGTP